MKLLAKRKGFSLIELLAVVAILAILILISFYAFKAQIVKGRDARRKADLAKLQKVLEDRLNDASCYPDQLVCDSDFTPYLPKVPCDPLNNLYYNYHYSFDGNENCKDWYKIYTRLENEKDPIIAQVGCSGGCGPGNNYNYWIGSSNVVEVTRLSGEDWTWPIAGYPVIGTIAPSGEPADTPTPTPTSATGGGGGGGGGGGVSPTPTIPPGYPPGTLSPSCWGGSSYYCLPNVCSSCCPGVSYRCTSGGDFCIPDSSCALQPTPTSSPDQTCVAAGGTWVQISSSCGDSCELVSDPGTRCMARMGMGCECGPTRCWDSDLNTCVANPPTPTPVPLTEEQSCPLSGGVWTQFGNSCADICGLGSICKAVLKMSCDCGDDKCWNPGTMTCQ